MRIFRLVTDLYVIADLLWLTWKLQNMYDEGDDEMKRTIAKAWTDARTGKTADPLKGFPWENARANIVTSFRDDYSGGWMRSVDCKLALLFMVLNLFDCLSSEGECCIKLALGLLIYKRFIFCFVWVYWVFLSLFPWGKQRD